MQTIIEMIIAALSFYIVLLSVRSLSRRVYKQNLHIRRESKKIDSVIVSIFLPTAQMICGKLQIKLSKKLFSCVGDTIRFSGLSKEFNVEEFVVVCALSGICGAILFAMIGGAKISFCGCIACALWPAVWLRGVVNDRRRKIRRDLVSALESIAIVVSAGLDFSPALVHVSEKMRPSPLKELFQEYASRILEGLSRKEALLAMADLSDEKNFKNFVRTLVQSDKLGTGISVALKRSASTVREEIYAAAKRRAVAASQASLFPLVMCIMPATFLVVFGPIFTRLYYGGIEALFRM